MGLEIRRLVDADAAAYKTLRDEVLAAHPTAFTSDAAQEALRPADSYRTRLQDEGGSFTLGAWQDDALLGALTCERDRRTKVRHVAELIGMMVAPAAQHRGIGRRLLEAGLDALRADGAVTLVTLSVTAGNDAAIGLYTACGFGRWGRLERAIRVNGTYHAKDKMALQL